MSKTKHRHPLRTLLMATAVIAVAVAVRNAMADKGGSYDPAEGGP